MNSNGFRTRGGLLRLLTTIDCPTPKAPIVSTPVCSTSSSDLPRLIALYLLTRSLSSSKSSRYFGSICTIPRALTIGRSVPYMFSLKPLVFLPEEKSKGWPLHTRISDPKAANLFFRINLSVSLLGFQILLSSRCVCVNPLSTNFDNIAQKSAQSMSRLFNSTCNPVSSRSPRSRSPTFKQNETSLSSNGGDSDGSLQSEDIDDSWKLYRSRSGGGNGSSLFLDSSNDKDSFLSLAN
mmetsp:Transcript_13083/g.19589  ORF Transcript_13083/g.19589 Transcript_13083/m.19589 type:complete len:237 (-) Transcript_13083:800-1510(-)